MKTKTETGYTFDTDGLTITIKEKGEHNMNEIPKYVHDDNWFRYNTRVYSENETEIILKEISESLRKIANIKARELEYLENPEKLRNVNNRYTMPKYKNDLSKNE